MAVVNLKKLTMLALILAVPMLTKTAALNDGKPLKRQPLLSGQDIKSPKKTHSDDRIATVHSAEEKFPDNNKALVQLSAEQQQQLRKSCHHKKAELYRLNVEMHAVPEHFSKLTSELGLTKACHFYTTVAEPTDANLTHLFSGLQTDSQYFYMGFIAIKQEYPSILQKLVQTITPQKLATLQDAQGKNTLSHYAARRSSGNATQILLSALSTIDEPKNSDGHTPLTCAFDAYNHNATAFILKHESQQNLPKKPIQISKTDIAHIKKELSHSKPASYLKTAAMPSDKNFEELFASYDQDQCLDIVFFALNGGHTMILKELVRRHNPNIKDWYSFVKLVRYAKIAPYIQTIYAPNDPTSAELFSHMTANEYVGLAQFAMHYNHNNVLQEIIKKEGPAILPVLLTYAIESQHPDAVKILAHAKADLNIEHNNKSFPLYNAYLTKNPILFKLLLDLKANPNQKHQDWPMLHVTSDSGHEQFTSALIQHQADLESRGKDDCTALHRAVRNNQVTCINTLISARADVEARTIHGYTPLIYSLGLKHDAATAALLPYTDLEKCPGNTHDSYLHFAVKLGGLAGLTLILDALKPTANLNLRNERNFTPLMSAAYWGKVEAIEPLLAKKADPQATPPQGYTLLHMAAASKSKKMLDLLLGLKLINPHTKANGKTYQDVLRDNALQQTLKDIEEGVITRPAFALQKSAQQAKLEHAHERKEESDNDDDIAPTPQCMVEIDEKHIFGHPVYNAQTKQFSGGHYSKKQLHIGDIIQTSNTAFLTVTNIDRKPQHAGFYRVSYHYQDNADPANPISENLQKTYFDPRLSQKDIRASALQTVQKPEAQEHKKVPQGLKSYYYTFHYSGPGHTPIVLKAAVTEHNGVLHLDTFHPIIHDEQEIARITLLKESAGNNPQ